MAGRDAHQLPGRRILLNEVGDPVILGALPGEDRCPDEGRQHRVDGLQRPPAALPGQPGQVRHAVSVGPKEVGVQTVDPYQQKARRLGLRAGRRGRRRHWLRRRRCRTRPAAPRIPRRGGPKRAPPRGRSLPSSKPLGPLGRIAGECPRHALAHDGIVLGQRLPGLADLLETEAQKQTRLVPPDVGAVLGKVALVVGDQLPVDRDRLPRTMETLPQDLGLLPGSPETGTRPRGPAPAAPRRRSRTTSASSNLPFSASRCTSSKSSEASRLRGSPMRSRARSKASSASRVFPPSRSRRPTSPHRLEASGYSGQAARNSRSGVSSSG